MVDKRNGYKVSNFYGTESDMVETTCAQFEKLRQGNKPVKMDQWDYAGENIKLQAWSDQAAWKLNIQFEYTDKDSPSQSHLT